MRPAPRSGSVLAVERLEDRTLLNGGGLDTTFGESGKVDTDLIGSRSDAASSVVWQPDGKLLVAGTSGNQLAVTRYNPDGSLDTSFGSDGKVLTGQTSGYNSAAGLILEADGKIILASLNSQPQIFYAGPVPGINPPGVSANITLTRLTSNGSLDASFGTNGTVQVPTGFTVSSLSAIAVQGDGKIVLEGTALPQTIIAIDPGHPPSPSINSVPFVPPTPTTFLARVTPDGSLDKTFGTDGITKTDLGTGPIGGSRMTVQTDGHIVVAGSTAGANFQSVATLERFNADGSLDTSFGTSGKVVTDINSYSPIVLAVQADGKVIVSGAKFSVGQPFSPSQVTVTRYNANGTLDTTFGTSGTARIDTGANSLTINSAIFQTDGKLVLVGGSYTFSTQFSPNFHSGHFALARLNADGSLDTSFGAKGLVQTDIGTNTDSAAAVTVQPDGKIVAVGRTDLHIGDFAVVRYNADGSLDDKFGTGGKATTDFMGPASATAAASALQKDGKIVVVGTVSSEFSLVRYNADGSVDTKFGVQGQVLTDFGTFSTASSVAIQSDGKILVAGSAGNKLALARYNPDGSLDTSFGTGGKILSDIGGTFAVNFRAALQTDGKIVVAGNVAVSPGIPIYTPAIGATPTYFPGPGIPIGQGSVVVARFNADGTLDTSFGTSGKVTTSLDSSYGQIGSVLVQSDGRIDVAGNMSGFDGKNRFFVLRYNADGSVDTSFGSGGKAIADGGSGAVAALQPDGKILLVGTAYPGYTGYPGVGVVSGPPISFNPQFALARFNTNGTLDNSFGTGGTATSDWGGYATAQSIALQADGKILVAGSLNVNGRNDFLLVRYNTDGSRDGTFGKGGKITTHFEQAEQRDSSGVQLQTTIFPLPPVFSQDQAASVLVQADGKIVVAGTVSYYSGPGPNSDFALARYLPEDGLPDQAHNFVSQVYLDLLQRDADAGGMAFWTGLLAQGVDRTQIVLRIENSTEYHTKQVDQMYLTLLGRAADPAGRNAFVDLLNAGGSVEQVKIAILGSQEYYQRAGGSSATFLDAVYRDVLNRSPDTSGAIAFGLLLAGGAPRGIVAEAILTSAESYQDQVQNLYQRSLHRPADTGGLNAFVAAMQQGAREEDVLATMCGSGEYFGRV
jgi:uncharacterized delta-60 repeat protein